jgi:short-subunit dehydrogenase
MVTLIGREGHCPPCKKVGFVTDQDFRGQNVTNQNSSRQLNVLAVTRVTTRNLPAPRGRYTAGVTLKIP